MRVRFGGSGENHDWNTLTILLLPQAGQDVAAVHIGEDQIQQDETDRGSLDLCEGFGSGGYRVNRISRPAQDRLERHPKTRFVVNEENPQGRTVTNWKEDSEGTPLPISRRLGPDPPSVQIDETFAEGEAEPGSLMASGQRLIQLCEGGKEPGKVLCPDADPRIADGNFDKIAVSFRVHGWWFMARARLSLNPERRTLNRSGGHAHGAAGLREFDGVGEEVVYHLPEANGIGCDGGHRSVDLQGEGNVFLDGALAHPQDSPLQKVCDRDPLQVQSELSRLDLAEIKDVVDQGQEVAAPLENMLDVPQLFVGQRPGYPFFEKLGEADDRVQGGTQFVGHGGEKVALGLAGPLKLCGTLLNPVFQFLGKAVCPFLGILVQKGGLDGHAKLFRHLGKQGVLGTGKIARRPAEQDEQSDKLTVRSEWVSGKRSEPLHSGDALRRPGVPERIVDDQGPAVRAEQAFIRRGGWGHQDQPPSTAPPSPEEELAGPTVEDTNFTAAVFENLEALRRSKGEDSVQIPGTAHRGGDGLKDGQLLGSKGRLCHIEWPDRTFPGCKTKANGIGPRCRIYYPFRVFSDSGNVLDPLLGGPYTGRKIPINGGEVAYPSDREDVGVSVLTGGRGDRLALALEGFFSSVNLPRIFVGERDGTGERQQLLRLLRDFVEAERRAIWKQHRQGARGMEVVQGLTELADVVISELYRRSAAVCRETFDVDPPCALLALGGYGRRELNPASDIDLMFLHPTPISPSVHALIHFLIPLLWDVGFHIGHSVRSVQDCARMAAEDLSSYTSMLEGHLLAGDAGLSAQMETVIQRRLRRRRGDAYIQAKLQERAARYAKYGGSVYMQEPHVKEGAGGLRDVHVALWIARVRHPVRRLGDLGASGLLSREELQHLHDAIDFVHRIRNELHYLSGRKNDLLLFHLQEPAAAHLDFGDDRVARGVERCMQHYYLRARTVFHLTERVIERSTRVESSKESIIRRMRARDLGDGLTEINREIQILPRNRRLFEDDPVRLLKIFWYALQTGYPVSSTAQEIIREHLYLIDDKFRGSSRALNFFLAILREPKGVAATLRLMHEVGVLGAYIPEFGELTCLVQYDLYHKYTVDMHTLLALEHLESLDEAPIHYAEEFRAIVAELKRPEVLKLGVLFHDIGKGEGHGHVARGAAMAEQILTRMGLPETEVAEVRFLVEHHLAMAQISQRRDLDDEPMLIEFARNVRDMERLKMLYLLTYLDIRAVAPEVWTAWKGTLLWELYIRTHTLLNRGIPEGVDELARAAEIKDRLTQELREEIPLSVVLAHLEEVPVRYLLAVPAAKVAAHLHMVERLTRGEEVAVEWSAYPLVGHSEVTVCAFGRPGRFAQIVGTLTANRMNILSAQIFTRRDGLVLRTFHVDDGKGGAIADGEVWRRFETDLHRVLAGQAEVEQLILSRQREIVSRPARKGGAPPLTRVEFDNYVSETHTVIDIRTHDRLGLLYTISKVLKELSLDIRLAKITTEVEQVMDVFYVTDRDGGKVRDEGRMEEIRERLETAIAHDVLHESRTDR